MSSPQPLRPRLIVNARLMRDFMTAAPPCCTLGVAAEGNATSAFVALRASEPILARHGPDAFNHGHALLGAPACAVLQLGFRFFDCSTYHVLINPSNPLVRAIVTRMVARRSYFVFAIAPDTTVTAFRADLRQDSLARLRQSLRPSPRVTTEQQYQDTLAEFRARPDPPGRVLEWVCRDDVHYLDLSQDPLDMSPAHC